MKKIGITATREGLAPQQFDMLRTLVRATIPFDAPSEAHHGDCVGGDAQFDYMVFCRFPRCSRIVHPPTNPAARCFCHRIRPNNCTVLAEFDYLVRNQHIVDSVDVMFICPKEFQEELRSGTWATYRLTKKADKEYFLIYPDGNWRHYKPKPVKRVRFLFD